MFKYLCVVALLVACCQSAPPGEPVAILNQENVNSPDGSYNWSFESQDGTKAKEAAQPKSIDKDTVVEDVSGSFTFVDPDGKNHAVEYTANEHGFFPKGSDIHSEIATHLAYLEAHPEVADSE